MTLLRTSVTRFARVAPRQLYLTSYRPQQRFAHQDYGSGAGNPAGEDPKKQGKNPREDLEHPGPPPPSKGKDSSSSSSSSSSSGESTSQQSSSKSSSDSKKPQPKILNESPPEDHEAPEDVRQHNKEMKERADRPAEGVRSHKDVENDKVNKDFWKDELVSVK